jgi:hypothetical protein
MKPTAIVILAVASSVPSTVLAVDENATPHYGHERFATGFAPDPFTVTVIPGGDFDASEHVHPQCTGFVSEAPDLVLSFDAGRLPLSIRAVSEKDTTLVVQGPDRRWYCDDDSGGDLNPMVYFAPPQTGRYAIWVGLLARPQGGSGSSTELSISELD